MKEKKVDWQFKYLVLGKKVYIINIRVTNKKWDLIEYYNGIEAKLWII